MITGKKVFVPRVFIIEVVAVAKRLGLEIDKREILNLISKFNIVGKERIFNIALYIADKVHPRAIDAYYIATAILTNSVIVSNDKILIENCKKAGIKAYYLIEEFDDLKKEIF